MKKHNDTEYLKNQTELIVQGIKGKTVIEATKEHNTAVKKYDEIHRELYRNV